MKYANLAFQLLGSIGICAWGGHWLDNRFKFEFPVFLLTFVFAAFAANMFLIYRSLKQDK